jgi:hypothetical protein
MKKRTLKMRLSRETLGTLDQMHLAEVVGATYANSGCASVCIGLCNPSDSCATQCYACPNQPPPSRTGATC